MVDHIHINDVVLHDNEIPLVAGMFRTIVSIIRLLPDRQAPRVRCPYILLSLLFLVSTTELEHYIKNASADVEIPQDPNHVFELGLFTDLQSLLKRRECLKLFEK